MITGVVFGLRTFAENQFADDTLTLLTVPPLDTANGTNVMLVVPIAIGELFVQTNIVSAFVVPSLENTDALTNSGPVSASVARVGAHDEFTMYIPFSVCVV